MSERAAFEIGRLYQPIKAIADTLTAVQKDVFVRLPGLQNYYPGGIRTQSGQLGEHARGGFDPPQVGTVITGYDGNAYSHLGNGTNYFAQIGVNGITGTETHIDSSMRGLTLGCWFSLDVAPVVRGGVISRDGIALNRGYAFAINSSNTTEFFVSLDGSAVTTLTGTALVLTQWHFLCARFTPGSEMATFVDGEKSTLTTSIPASIFLSTQAFEVGRHVNNNARIITGKIRDIFMCSAALSDELITQIRITSQP